MTLYELHEKVWETFWNGIGEDKRNLIETGWKKNLIKQNIEPSTVNNDSYKSNIYGTLVSFTSSLIAGNRYFIADIDEDGNVLHTEPEPISNVDVLCDLLGNTNHIRISKKIASDIVDIIEKYIKGE